MHTITVNPVGNKTKAIKKLINHYQKIVVAQNETILIISKIDEVIAEHGGWLAALVTWDE